MKLAFASLAVAAFVYTLPVQWRTPPTLHTPPLALPTQPDQPDPYADEMLVPRMKFAKPPLPTADPCIVALRAAIIHYGNRFMDFRTLPGPTGWLPADNKDCDIEYQNRAIIVHLALTDGVSPWSVVVTFERSDGPYHLTPIHFEPLQLTSPEAPQPLTTDKEAADGRGAEKPECLKELYPGAVLNDPRLSIAAREKLRSFLCGGPDADLSTHRVEWRAR